MSVNSLSSLSSMSISSPSTMSVNSLSTYKFKPYEFTFTKVNKTGIKRFTTLIGCNEDYFFAYGFPEDPNIFDINDRHCYISLWKCNLISGQTRLIQCKNIPSDILAINTNHILSNNMLIEIGGSNDSLFESFGEIIRNRIYIGNLADEHKDCGMQFKELDLSGDIPLPHPINNTFVVDGHYIYLLSNEFGNPPRNLYIHRLDTHSNKWEMLYKTNTLGSGPEPKYQDEFIFYKGGIYVFGLLDNRRRHMSRFFMTIHKFSVIEKKWELIPINQKSWPEFGYESIYYGCVQYPYKSKLVYLFGSKLGGIWRFDMDNLQWENLKLETPELIDNPRKASVTPSGRMCCYAERWNNNTNAAEDILISSWFTIPKLKIIAWEAVIHYFKNFMLNSNEKNLKKIGIPEFFCKKIIEARVVPFN